MHFVNSSLSFNRYVEELDEIRKARGKVKIHSPMTIGECRKRLRKNLKETKKNKGEMIFRVRFEKIFPSWTMHQQYPVLNRFFLDFANVPKKVCVEIDGESHLKKMKYDQCRDKILSYCGWRILRLDLSKGWAWRYDFLKFIQDNPDLK